LYFHQNNYTFFIHQNINNNIFLYKEKKYYKSILMLSFRTINKSQVRPLKYVEYIFLSPVSLMVNYMLHYKRVTSKKALKILISGDEGKNSNTTENVVLCAFVTWFFFDSLLLGFVKLHVCVFQTWFAKNGCRSCCMFGCCHLMCYRWLQRVDWLSVVL
jgi:hypothetical protein